MTVKDTILDEIRLLFQAEGIEAYTEQELRNRLDISQATFKELFTDKEDLVRQTIIFDLQRQKEQQAVFLKKANSAIEEILLLLQDAINNTRQTNPVFISELQHKYPATWQLILNHLETHSYFQLSDIINRGIQQNEFRKDINIQLVTKIMLEMVTMIFNPQVFPPERYTMPEVFRSMFLYYIRGVCTDGGAKKAEEYFSKFELLASI